MNKADMRLELERLLGRIDELSNQERLYAFDYAHKLNNERALDRLMEVKA